MTEEQLKTKRCQMTALTRNCVGSECAAFRYKTKIKYDEDGKTIIKDDNGNYIYDKIKPEQVFCGMAQHNQGIFN